MEYTRELVETKTVESTFTHQDREETLNWSEGNVQQTATLYEELGEIIRKYNTIILFGPTEAKK